MPLPQLPPGPEWTDAEVDAVRRRGKKLALDRFLDDSGTALELTPEDAAKLMQAEGAFDGRTPKWAATMVVELHDFAHRFHAELRGLAS